MYGLKSLVDSLRQRIANRTIRTQRQRPQKRKTLAFFTCEEVPCQIVSSAIREILTDLSLHKPVITQAFVLAAGLGTRLRPLTDELPKPLVPIFQKPLITFALDHLIASGIWRFVVNTHRLPHLFERQFAEKNYRRAHLIS